jgi:methylamine dehydrogenase accessory protein MauD
MAGWWLISYLALWVIMIVLGFLVIGCLQQIGLLQRQLTMKPTEPEEAPPLMIEQQGPGIGSQLPALSVETINGYGRITLQPQRTTLLLFLSPLCEGCQQVVEPLNAFVKERGDHEYVIVILQADKQGCRAFLSVFPVSAPVVCDESRTITNELFNAHSNPFGLFYDEQGILVRKGLAMGNEELHALVGEEVTSDLARSRIIPVPEVVSMPVSA